MKRTLLLLSFSCLLSVNAMSQTVIKFFTTMGNFYVEMSDSLTPITSGNFIDLVEEGYYDGVIFHRVISGFMIQGGDPTGTGSGGPGYTIQDEFDSTGTLSNIQKTISMANTGQPNSGGSQFFINLVNNTFLDFDKAPLSSKHPVFGMVIDSFDVVQAIGLVATNSSNRPIVDVVMDSLRRFQSSDTMIQRPPLGDRITKQSQMKVKVVPNPVEEWSVATVDAPESGQATIEIRDQFGRLVSSKDIELRKGMNRIEDLGLFENGVSSGFYFLQLKSATQQETIKLNLIR